tara:strand:- start:1266 stop:1979 length:714 start_codon:yes stop_codon:yes gene_type:complete
MTEEHTEQEENPEPTQFSLPNCGEIRLENNEIKGWFYPISIYQWREIIGFHKTMSIIHKAETVSYHRWNNKNQKYDTVIPYQETVKNGLSVDVDWEDHRNVELLDGYAEKNGVELFPACTIHTHVASGAFESGTDAGDEEDYPGWHLTLGHLTANQKKIDTHSRFRLPKIERVTKHTSVQDAYEFNLEKLFPEGLNIDQVTHCPWNNKNLHKFKDRVTLTQKRPSRTYFSQGYYNGI